MAEQLSFELFEKPRERTSFSSYNYFLEWAHEYHKCPPEIDPIARKVFDTMPEPFDRCKALVTLCRLGRYDEREVDAIGLLECEDYHDCWDRAFAIRAGLSVDKARRVRRVEGYAGRPRFYDEDGNLLGTGDTGYRRPFDTEESDSETEARHERARPEA